VDFLDRIRFCLKSNLLWVFHFSNSYPSNYLTDPLFFGFDWMNLAESTVFVQSIYTPKFNDHFQCNKYTIFPCKFISLYFLKICINLLVVFLLKKLLIKIMLRRSTYFYGQFDYCNEKIAKLKIWDFSFFKK
jgi:hypothetical protein